MMSIIHVDEIELHRRGLKLMLHGSDFTVIASVATVSDAIAAIAQHPSAILVTEIIFERMLNLAPLHEAKRNGMLSVVWSLSKSNPHLDVAHEVQAADYISIAVDRVQLIHRLQCVLKGTNSPLNPYASRKMRINADLTSRESQVLHYLATGLTNKEIGSSLSISFETVKEHVQSILRKLGVHDRTQAAVWWVRQGQQV